MSNKFAYIEKKQYLCTCNDNDKEKVHMPDDGVSAIIYDSSDGIW